MVLNLVRDYLDRPKAIASPSSADIPTARECLRPGNREANPKQVEQYRGGKKMVDAFFIGQAVKI